MKKTIAVINSLHNRYYALGKCAIDSFKKWHPKIDMFIVNDETVSQFNDDEIIKKIHADFFIKNNEELFDIIFFDPPFVLDNSIQLIEFIRKFLKPNGVIYFETNLKLPENFLEIIKTSRVGKVYFHLVH